MDENRHDGSQRRRPSTPRLTQYAGMGVELAGAVIGLTLVGLWVDHHWQCYPTGVIIGAAVGIIGGGYNFIRQALALIRAQERARQGGNTGAGGDAA